MRNLKLHQQEHQSKHVNRVEVRLQAIVSTMVNDEDAAFLRAHLDKQTILIQALHRKKNNQRKTLQALNRKVVILKYDLGVAQRNARKARRNVE